MITITITITTNNQASKQTTNQANKPQTTEQLTMNNQPQQNTHTHNHNKVANNKQQTTPHMYAG